MRLLTLSHKGALVAESQLVSAPDEEDMAQLFDLYERLGRDWSRVAAAYDGRILLNSSDTFIYRSGLGNRIEQIDLDGQIVKDWTTPIDFESGLVGIDFFAAGEDGVAYGSRGGCDLGWLQLDGASAAFAHLPSCPSHTPTSVALDESRVYVARPSGAPESIEVAVYDLRGRLIDVLVVRGPDVATDEPVAWFPMASDIDVNGNLILLVTAIVGRDDGGELLMSTHLLTMDPSGAVLSPSELPSADQRIDLAVASDGTLGLLYRDSAEVLLFEPIT
jgi:hypothetical protein